MAQQLLLILCDVLTMWLPAMAILIGLDWLCFRSLRDEA